MLFSLCIIFAVAEAFAPSTIGVSNFQSRILNGPFLKIYQRQELSRSEVRGSLHTTLRAVDLNTVFDATASFISDADPASAAISLPFKDSEITSYSKSSYYATLALYGLSFPGLWSTIKRSTKAKVKRKTYECEGEGTGGRSVRTVAGEIMAYMKANNYEVADAGETITFKGLVPKSKSQAFFLTFCTALCLASLALVLQIQFIDLKLPGGGDINWFYMVALSPYAGVYYWRSGDREDNFELKLVEADDLSKVEINVLGDEEEIDRMWRTLNFVEKGMVKVEGLLAE